MEKDLFSAKKITYFAILSALVIILQMFGGSLKIGTVSLNFTLIPVVLCGMLLGVFYGTLIGFIVGIVTLIMVITGMDGWSLILFNQRPLVIVLVCLVKGTLSGFVSAVVYKAIKNKNFSSVLSSVLAPIVNTGVFVLGMMIIMDTVEGSFNCVGSGYYYIFILVCGVNFLVELGLNVVLATATFRVAQVVKRR